MSYLWKEERQDDKADPVDNAGKLESIRNCWEMKRGQKLGKLKKSSQETIQGNKVFLNKVSNRNIPEWILAGIL